MSDAVSEGINAHLEAENERLTQELAEIKAMLSRPINVSTPGVNEVIKYLPQLTQIATNLSYVASNIQALLPALGKIADRLEPPKPEAYARTVTVPLPYVSTSPTSKPCRCEGATHAYTQGYCPPSGPRI